MIEKRGIFFDAMTSKRDFGDVTCLPSSCLRI